MEYPLKKTIFILFYLAILPITSYADRLTMATDPWPPLVFEQPNPDLGEGIMVEIAKAAFAKVGHTAVLQVVPWSRAKQVTENGSIDILLGSAKNPDREKLYVFPSNEVVANTTAFYTLTSSSWAYAGSESLTAVLLGVVAGYEYPAISDYIKAGEMVDSTSGDNALELLLKKLVSGRIGAVLDNSMVIQYQAKLLNIPNRIRMAGRLETTLGYAAISKKNPRAVQLAADFDWGMSLLRSSGDLKKLLNRYGVTDWK